MGEILSVIIAGDQIRLDQAPEQEFQYIHTDVAAHPEEVTTTELNAPAIGILAAVAVATAFAVRATTPKSRR